MDDDPTRFEADLRCEHCGVTGPHRLTYAGRILVSTHCEACGAEHRHAGDDLRGDYLQDLEHRVISKPGRMIRRFSRDPVGYLLGLPATVIRKPLRMITELRVVRRR